MLFRFLLGIRNALMESPEHRCPSCDWPGQSPDSLIPNVYLRALVTSFINDTSYVSTKKSAAATLTTSSVAARPSAEAASSARTVDVKSEPAAAAASGNQLPPHLTRGPPQGVCTASQVKSEPMSTGELISSQLQHSAAGTQLSSGPGYQVVVRPTAGYQASRPVGQGPAASHRASPSGQIPSHHVSSYLQPPLASASGVLAGQSHSAPSLLTHQQPE